MKKMTMPQGSGASMRRKLYSALSMLLVSGIMMVTSSYAWFVMSTAPEVKGIQTQVGANGALEIALLDKDSWTDLSRLDMGDIDENATTEQNAVTANLTWGNLVNLESATYGLSNIILQPSRLNVKSNTTGEGENAVTNYTVNGGTLLKTPVYGEDGRVKKLEEKAVASIYKAEDKAFNETGYGVRAIGTAANMSTFQLGMNAARTQISNFTTSARSAASTALNTHGGNMASIAVAYALQGKEDGYTKQDIENIKALAVDMQAAVDQIENGMRQVYAGYITTKASGVTAENYQTALEDISTLPLGQLNTKYPNAITTEYDISDFIAKLTDMQGKITAALNNCNDKINGTKDSFNWNEISGIITPLVDINGITVGGKNVTQLKSELKKPDGSINFDAAIALLQGGGLTITVGSGSGLLSDIADFVGDYTATVAVKDVTVGTYHVDSMDVGMETKTNENPPILTACSNKLAAQALTEATGSSAITDYYGYAIDLAFRTNATNSSLQLQTEPANRIYNDGSSQNEALQGGGSYMTFKTEAGLSATKMVKLMNGVRVVFMDKEQNVLKLAKLDTTLGQNNYTQLKDQTDDNFAYLNAFPSETATTYQKSDIISKAEYNKLPATGTVEFKTAEDGTNTVTAKLYLYEFSMTTKPNADGTTHQTGGITIGNKITSTAITALEADTPMIVTALVYLDGSVVNNSMVAASALQSMTGTLNLQFSSSAQLMPAQNTALKDGKNNNTSGG